MELRKAQLETTLAFFFATDDAVVQPWNMKNMDPTKFWVSPLWMGNLEGNLDGPTCGFAEANGTWEPCCIQRNSSMMALEPAGLTEHDTLIFNPHLAKEYRPWHAEAALQFCTKLDRGIENAWHKMWQLNTGIPIDACPVLQSSQPDMNYVPAAHANEWAKVVQLMDSSGMEFHHIFATVPVGMVPSQDIEVLLTYFTSTPCSEQLRKYSHWHGIHPCKFHDDPDVKQHIESLFRTHRAAAR